jgi:hypothetical protein
MRDFQSILRILSVVFCFFLTSCSTCKKFVNYETSTVDIAGIKARIGDKVDARIGTFNIDPKLREVSEEIQKLDMVQYNICMNLEKMSQGEERTRQVQNYNDALINMYKKFVNPAQEQSGNSNERGLIKTAIEDTPTTVKYYAKFLYVPDEVKKVWIIMQNYGPLIDGSSDFYEFTDRNGLIGNFEKYIDYARKNNKRLIITASDANESSWQYQKEIKYLGVKLKEALYRSPDQKKSFFGVEVPL